MSLEDSGQWWATGAAYTRGLLEVFKGHEPSLKGACYTRFFFDLFPYAAYADIDLGEFPEEPHPRWVREGYDTINVGMRFVECRDVVITGGGDSHVEIRPIGNGRVAVVLEGAMATIRMTAELRVLNHRAYKKEQ